jgi:hypothetical protein
MIDEGMLSMRETQDLGVVDVESSFSAILNPP